MGHARAHFLRVSAQHLAAKPDAGRSAPDLTAYEQMLALLVDHRRRLKEIQSTERKIELKRQLLPDYAPWINGVIAGDSGLQDEVFTTTLIWSIDVEDWPQALRMAAYAIKHQLILPDRFERTLGTVIVEEVVDIALKPGAEVAVDVLIEIDNLSAAEDMPDQVRSKLYKAIGLRLVESSKPELALDYLTRALGLFANIGVKKDIERLERQLKKAGSDAGATNTAAPAA